MNGEMSFAIMPFVAEVPELLWLVEVDDPTDVANKITTIINGINGIIPPKTYLTIFMKADDQTLPWHDNKVAQALAMAIDRQTIMNNQGVTVNLRRGQEQWLEHYNPEKAKQLPTVRI